MLPPVLFVRIIIVVTLTTLQILGTAEARTYVDVNPKPLSQTKCISDNHLSPYPKWVGATCSCLLFTSTSTECFLCDSKSSASYGRHCNQSPDGVDLLLSAHTSKYQSFQIISEMNYDHVYYTNLYIEGHLQSSTLDEYIYHEALVHPALLAHKKPKRVVILGGGEGATLRTVLSHQNVVQSCTMVELDIDIVNQCKKYMPKMSQGAFESNKTELIISDAYAWVKNYRRRGFGIGGYDKTKEKKYDVAIMDILDPEDIVSVNGSAAARLYHDLFFKYVAKRVLSKRGIFVMQAGEISATDPYHMTKYDIIKKMLSQYYKKVIGYMVYVPSFGSEWGFLLGCKKVKDCNRISHNNAGIFDVEFLENEIERRKINDKHLKYYDHITHQRLFSMPPSIRLT